LRDGGETISLSDFVGRVLVVYFYPKADTAGCTLDAREFSALLPAFREAGAAVLGVSADPGKKLEAVKPKPALEGALGSDEGREMLTKYGVWVEKSMYGRKFMGVERATFLIGPDGRIVKLWRKVKAPGHAEAVLGVVKALSAASQSSG